MSEEITLYLGDGAYVAFDGYGYRLYTERENGEHWIYLEGAAFDALVLFRERMKAALGGEEKP